jgi:very-short-patch-repair endonuclease
MAAKAAAAWLWSRRRGVVTGRAAASLHGALWVDDTTPVEMVSANNHSPAGIVTHRDRIADDEICELIGIAVATPARTALDLGRKLPRDRAVRHLDALARATGITMHDIEPLTKRYAGTKGVRLCRHAVELMNGGSQSPKETWLRLLLIDAGYPRPRTQIPLYEYGAVVANLDMGWPQIRVSVEYDGDQHRTDRDTYVKDMRRVELVDRLGWLNIRVVKEDRDIDILARVRDAWTRREREGMVVKSSE